MIKQYITPHCHPASIDSGSTPAAMIEQFKAMGTGYATITDHGFMGDCYKFYELAKKAKIKPILGVEAYFKDDGCTLAANTTSAQLKYHHCTLHFIDQPAYQKGCEVMSKADRFAIITGGERKPIISWSDLIELSQYNVTIGSGCLIGMVSRHLLAGNPHVAEQYYLRLRNMFQDRFFVELLPHVCDKKWENGVKMILNDPQPEDAFQPPEKETLFVWDGAKFDTDQDEKVTALAISKDKSHSRIHARYVRNKREIYEKDINTVEKVQGFVEQEGGDVQLVANRFCYEMAKRHGDKILISDDAHYAKPEDVVVQNLRLGENFRFYGSYHLMTSAEACAYFIDVMGIAQSEVEQWIENSYEWAKKFDAFELKYKHNLPVPERPAMEMVGQWIREMGRFPVDNPVYVERLRWEIDTFVNNGTLDILPYFIPIKKIYEHCRQVGTLTGPGRGSAGGSLLAYLIGITHVDPIKYDLPFERFFSADRVKKGDVPDIDSDFSSRIALVGEDDKSGFLFKEWGDCVAQISTRTMMRLKSAIRDVNRFKNKGDVETVIHKLCESLPTPPQGIPDSDFLFGYKDADGIHVDGIFETSVPLQNYAKERPDEWNIVTKAVGLSRQNSRHAAAFVIANKPIGQIVPTFTVADVPNVIQYEAPSVEKAGLIKYDFLVVSALKDVEVCLNLINKKNGASYEIGYFDHEGVKTFVWDLPERRNVYEDLWAGATETVFQVHTTTMLPFVQNIRPQNIPDLATILALCRPGPMDAIDEATGRTMADEYMERRKGNSVGNIEILNRILPETYGILVFQEQVNKIAKQIGGFSPLEAESLRKVLSKKKLAEALKFKVPFMENAKKVIDEKTADIIWGQMETFARYGFNTSHAVAYATTSYATAFLKHYYPLEWWAAVLSNAEDKEINEKFYRHVKDLLIAPDINQSDESITIDYAAGKLRSKLSMIAGLGAKIAEAVKSGRPYKDCMDMVHKGCVPPAMCRKMIYVGAMDRLFASGLTPMQKMQHFEDCLSQHGALIKLVAKKNKAELDKFSSDPKIVKKGQKVLDALPDNIVAAQKVVGAIDVQYIGMSPIQDYIFKKLVLPSMPLSLSDIVRKYYPTVQSGGMCFVEDSKNRATLLLDGPAFSKADSMVSPRDVFYAAPAFVLSAKQFTYSGGKRAMKIMCEMDGISTEMVMWPNYHTGELNCPELKKGTTVLFFIYKQEMKDHGRLYEIKVVEQPREVKSAGKADALKDVSDTDKKQET